MLVLVVRIFVVVGKIRIVKTLLLLYIFPAVRDNFYESSLYWLQRGQKEAGSELMGLADLDSNYHSPHA